MGRTIFRVSLGILIIFAVVALIPIVRHLLDPSYKVPRGAWWLARGVVAGAVTLLGYTFLTRRRR